MLVGVVVEVSLLRLSELQCGEDCVLGGQLPADGQVLRFGWFLSPGFGVLPINDGVKVRCWSSEQCLLSFIRDSPIRKIRCHQNFRKLSA